MTNIARRTTLGTMLLVAVVLVAFAAAAFAAPGGGKGKGKDKGGPAPAPSPTATATQEPPGPATANDADVAFMEMMIPHHHQATVMSRMAPGASQDEAVLALASRIDAEQGVEIATMQLWQESYGFPVTDPETAYAMMLRDPMMVQMMGMATQAELDELAGLTGTAFDRLFLQLMIDHHNGAIDMVVDVQGSGTDPVVSQLSMDMLATQQVQVDLMQELLDQLG